MKRNKKKEPFDGLHMPLPSSSDLRGRQSVRATFRLSERAIDAIGIVSVHLGIKQKSLFDHLIEDTEALTRIAGEMKARDPVLPDRIQKTFVISRRTLSCLKRVSKDFDAPRDALVEYSVQRLLPLIEQEREKHKKRKAVLERMTEYLKEGKKILDQASASLGEEDPVYEKAEDAMVALVNACRFIETFVEKGKIIEDF